jgi:hypothetical protein
MRSHRNKQMFCSLAANTTRTGYGRAYFPSMSLFANKNACHYVSNMGGTKHYHQLFKYRVPNPWHLDLGKDNRLSIMKEGKQDILQESPYRISHLTRYVASISMACTAASIAFNRYLPFYSEKHRYKAIIDPTRELGIQLEEGKTTAFVLTWKPSGLYPGHAAVLLVSNKKSKYISFWPKCENEIDNVKKFSQHGAAFLSSLNQDISTEGGKLPTIQRIDGLNEEKINAFVTRFERRVQKGKIKFALFHHLNHHFNFFSSKSSYNCTGVVDEILVAGDFPKTLYTAPYGRAPGDIDVLTYKGAELIEEEKTISAVFKLAGYDEADIIKRLAKTKDISSEEARSMLLHQDEPINKGDLASPVI